VPVALEPRAATVGQSLSFSIAKWTEKVSRALLVVRHDDDDDALAAAAIAAT
jgi:hypothetical protein